MLPRKRRGLISQGPTADPAPPNTNNAEDAPANPPPPSTPPKKAQEEGLYSNGKWYCNCKPRARAKSLVVKKDGPSKGRRFYSCRFYDKDDECDFFLWAENADERAAAVGDAGAPTSTTPRRRDQSIRKFFAAREQGEESAGQETPSRRGGVMEVDGDASPSRAGNGKEPDGGRGEECPEDAPTTPRAPTRHIDPAPITPIRRPQKRPREDDDEYSLSDFSSGEEEQAEQILSAASRRTNMSPPPAPAVTPSRRPDLSASTPVPPAAGSSSAFPTPSTRPSLSAKRHRLGSTPSQPVSNPQTPTNNTNPETPQTPNANTAASINADISSILTLVTPHLDPSASSQLQAHLERISMKAESAGAQRKMSRQLLETRDRQVAELKGRNAALENEVRELRERMESVRGGMLNLYQKT